MATIYDVDANELIEKAALELKNNPEIKPPVWAAYVKTGRHKERPPVRDDWWYIRAASILRKVYRYNPIGVSKLRKYYGGKANNGFKTEHAYKGSGSIIRKVLQQLEKAKLLKKEEKDVRRGRLLTPEGVSFLDKIATKMVKGRIIEKEEVKPKESPKKEEPKKEAKPETTKKEEVQTKEAPKKEEKAETVKKEEVKPKESPKKEEQKQEVKPETKEKPVEKKQDTKPTENPKQEKNG